MAADTCNPRGRGTRAALTITILQRRRRLARVCQPKDTVRVAASEHQRIVGGIETQREHRTAAARLEFVAHDRATLRSAHDEFGLRVGAKVPTVGGEQAAVSVRV